MLDALLTLEPAVAHGLYASQIVSSAEDSRRVVRGLGRLRQPLSQGLGWFADALDADALPDLWHDRPPVATTAPEEDSRDGPNTAQPGAS